MKIFIVKDHTLAGAKLFCAKINVSSYSSFEVGQFDWRKEEEEEEEEEDGENGVLAIYRVWL